MPTKMSGMEFWRQDCLKLRFFYFNFPANDNTGWRCIGGQVNGKSGERGGAHGRRQWAGLEDARKEVLFFCRQNISNIFFFKNCFFLWSFRIFFSAQTRSTPSFHADVACRMFHTGCKIQVSSKSPSPLSSERALIIFMLIIRFRANTSIFTWMVKAIGIQSQQQ